MEERFNDIEMHLMHHEDMVQQLNEVVTRQQHMIDRLTAEVAMLKEQLCAMTPSNNRLLEEEEPPPHY